MSGHLPFLQIYFLSYSRNLSQILRELPTTEEDHDTVGRKVSAMFLAQVDIEEDKAGKNGEGGGDDKEGKQKKGFLQGLR